MVRIISILFLAAGLAGCGYGGALQALSFSSSPRSQPEKLPGRVYLFRGLIGDVFSLGMDELAGKIERRGVKASVHGISAAFYLTDRIIREYRDNPAATAPIVLIGHSTGGDAIVSIAHKLKAANVPVGLAFAFDPTPVSARVPSNVDLFVNLYQGSNLIGGATAKPEAGFRGRLINVDLRERREIIHITLDKSDVIHDLVVEKIVGAAQRAAAGASAAAAVDAKASARKKRSRDSASSENPPEITPLVIRYVVPTQQKIELWDSAVRVTTEPGDTLATVAHRTGAPEWAIAQINKLDADHPLQGGQDLLIPRNRLVGGAESPEVGPGERP